jgi:hypothetical protein
MKLYSVPRRWISTQLMARLFVALFIVSTVASAQDTPSATSTTADTEFSPKVILRLETLSNRITDLQAARTALLAENNNAIASLNETQMQQLQELDAELLEVRESFALLALGDVDESVFEQNAEEDFNWQQELSDVAAPIFDSIKNVTEKSRQLSELRADIDQNELQIKEASRAIRILSSQSDAAMTPSLTAELSAIKADWEDRLQTAEDKLLSNETRMQILQDNQVPVSQRLHNGLRDFVLGRGLTLLLAVGAAAFVWLLFRAIWWLVVNRLLTKHTRRKAIWFRLASYSFALFTGIAMFIAFIGVLQARQDTLLLAVALLLVVTLLLGMRTYLPNYLTETRLLLNMGSVREEERVLYNGIPWNVEAINLQTILRNPALNGVLRLPIADIKKLTSRPYKDTLWFPTDRDDYILLPDDTFGRVVEQTPELVQVSVRGGMLKSFATGDFYAMPITNLSRGEKFGITSVFGLDYGLQKLSLTEIPTTLKAHIDSALREQGYHEPADNLLVELNEAGASSLDFLIFAQFPSSKANEYFSLSRTILQACVEASNQNGWSIPFPQLVVHQPT